MHGKLWVNAVLKSTPALSALPLVAEVRRVLGLPLPRPPNQQTAGKSILALHFLLQDETQQASFSWHDDGEDLIDLSGPNHARDMTTVIVNLSCVCSGMRIWGCAPVLYRVQGDAVAFPGRALHESLALRPDALGEHPVHKVALFFN